MSLLSILIPCYNKNERGKELLAYSLSKIKIQTFKDFEIIISDNSEDDIILKYLETEKDLNIKYTKNETKKTLACNMNNAIKNANAEILHIMCQDDYFYNKNSLQKIVDNFDKKIGWMVSMYMHTKDRLGLFKQQIPVWNNQIYLNNTIGTPSCLTLLNDNPPLLDENLNWFVDCEHYYRLFQKYGEPKILKDLIFVQYLWEGQVTGSITQELIDTEVAYIKNKYNIGQNLTEDK